MKYILCISCALLFSLSQFCTSQLNAASNGAMGRVTLSSHSIALNESVGIEISSLELLTGTDIAKIIVSTLELPSNRKNWKLIGTVQLKRSSKTKSFKCNFHVRPRHSGELALPDLPARWQKGNTIMRLGTVSVRDKINIGNEDKATPSELISVGGFSWDLDYAQLKKKIGTGGLVRNGDNQIHTTKDGLELIVRQRQLSGARITLKGWYLRQARFNFIDRWGEPTIDALDSDKPHLNWALGWLSITVSEHINDSNPVLSIDIAREDIEDRLVQSSVKRNVFKLLESDQSADELWKKTEKAEADIASGSTAPPTATIANPEPTAAPAPKKATPVKKSDSEKDLDRLFEEAKKNLNP